MYQNNQDVNEYVYNPTDQRQYLGPPLSGFGFLPGYIGRPGIALGGLGTGFGLYPGYGFGAPGFGFYPYPPYYPIYPPYPVPYR